jgi:hypothetical protein
MLMLALTGLAHRIMALPGDRLVAWCLFLVPLIVSFSIWLLLADEIERSLARKIGRWTRSGDQATRLLLLVTLSGATIFAVPASAETSDRVACSVPFAEVRLSNKSTGVLNQNSPNPFGHVTTINYKLPDKMKEARLMFYDAQGKLIKVVHIARTAIGDEDAQCTGLGRVTVFGEDLRDGTYTYVLVVDGRVVGSKTMTKSG